MSNLTSEELELLTSNVAKRNSRIKSAAIFASILVIVLLISIVRQNIEVENKLDKQLAQSEKNSSARSQQIQNELSNIQNQHIQQDNYLQCLIALDTKQPNAVVNCPPPNFNSSNIPNGQTGNSAAESNNEPTSGAIESSPSPKPSVTPTPTPTLAPTVPQKITSSITNFINNTLGKL